MTVALDQTRGPATRWTGVVDQALDHDVTPLDHPRGPRWTNRVDQPLVQTVAGQDAGPTPGPESDPFGPNPLDQADWTKAGAWTKRVSARDQPADPGHGRRDTAGQPDQLT